MSNNTLDKTVDTVTTQTQDEAKTYTQEEFDHHMAGLKASLTKKITKQYAELGDIDELKEIKTQFESKQQEEQIARGEFQKTLQDLASKKDLEIQKRDNIIKEYKVNTPLLNAASQYKSVNPEQVQALLTRNVQLNNDGEVEVVDSKGAVRYNDKGVALGVNDLVREFLDANPHFVQPAPSTVNTKSSQGNLTSDTFDISKLDLTKPEHREKYKEAKAKGLL